MTTVLVVDDEPIVREVVVCYLAREGHRTLEAADGESARATIERAEPDLVVLDVVLPRTDGLVLCRWIRSSSELLVVCSRRGARKQTASSGSSSAPMTT